MKSLIKIISIIIVILIIFSGFFLIYNNQDDDKKNQNIEIDTEMPKIDSITKNLTVTAGKISTIEVTFSDNVNVTEAILFYKKIDDQKWFNVSIINQSFELEIPANPIKDWIYYIIVNDEAGNGPVGSPSIDGSKYYTIFVEENIENLVHNVFIEEGTATWCKNCPTIAENLHELFEENKYNFYYVSMIEDKNTNAQNRIKNDYNIYFYPSLYIDGGYDLLSGEQTKETILEKINKAGNRDVPKIRINLSSELKVNDSNIKTTVLIKNFEDEIYEGRLKLYLTQRNSFSYFGGEGNYHFGFEKYIYNELIEVLSKEEKTIDVDLEIGSYDPDNLMIIGVLFDTESVEKYSDDENEYPFNAYYADACDGSLVVENANLKPNIGITFPIKARLHLFGKEITSTLRLNTILIGRTKIQVQAIDDSKVEKVEFYINDELVETLTSEPYEYLWKSTPFLKFRHEIKVIAYDDQGKSSEEIMDVFAFILL